MTCLERALKAAGRVRDWAATLVNSSEVARLSIDLGTANDEKEAVTQVLEGLAHELAPEPSSLPEPTLQEVTDQAPPEEVSMSRWKAQKGNRVN